MPEAIDAVGSMLSGYPNAAKGAPNSYVGTIAALLCTYPKSIALRCADPLTGVARLTKFMPTVSDVVAWCEAPVESMERIVEFDVRSDQQLKERLERERLEREQTDPPAKSNPVPRGYRCNVFVPPHAPQYQAMVERAHGPNVDRRDWFMQPDRVGIWVPLGWFDAEQAKVAKTWRRYTGKELMEMYGQPPYPSPTEAGPRATPQLDGFSVG